MIKTILKIDGMMCGMCEAHMNDAVRNAFKVKICADDRRFAAVKTGVDYVVYSSVVERGYIFRTQIIEDKQVGVHYEVDHFRGVFTVEVFLFDTSENVYSRVINDAVSLFQYNICDSKRKVSFSQTCFTEHQYTFD